MMDMAVNPHLLAIVRDEDGNMVGRSVIRLFKRDWSETTEPIVVAPSRLYLNKHTNAKNDVYAGLFIAVNKWAEESFDNHVMVAYRMSRHDSSIRSILRQSNKFTITLPSGNEVNKIRTQFWLPWWRAKPDNGDADFTYYKDEDQRCYVKQVKGSPNWITDYAVYEWLDINDYAIVEVNDD